MLKTIEKREKKMTIIRLHPKFVNRYAKYLREISHESDDFVETGGYLLGRYNGQELQIIDLVKDSSGNSTYETITLSGEGKRQAEKQAKFHGTKIVGIFHIHPPGYGTQYSNTDVSTLFLDRMALKADSPDRIDNPTIYLISSRIGEEIVNSFYMMRIDTLGKLRNGVKDPKAIASLSEIYKSFNDSKKERIGLVVQNGSQLDLMPYRPWNFRKHKEDIIGFFQIFRDTIIDDLQFQKIFISNFLNQIKSCPNKELYYFSISENYDHHDWKVYAFWSNEISYKYSKVLEYKESWQPLGGFENMPNIQNKCWAPHIISQKDISNIKEKKQFLALQVITTFRGYSVSFELPSSNKPRKVFRRLASIFCPNERTTSHDLVKYVVR